MSANPRILALFGARVILGSERGNIEALSALQEEGCKILCLVRNEKWNDHIAETLSARGFTCRKVPYIDNWQRGWRLWILFRNPVAFLVGNWKLLAICRKYRPTHIYAFNQFYVLNFFLALTLVRTPMIYRAGDAPTLHRWVWQALWQFVVWRTQQFVAISKFVARVLEESGVTGERVEVIYSRPPAREAKSEYAVLPQVEPGRKDVVFVGQIIEAKGPHLLIEAFGRLADEFPGARLLIVGRISDWSGDDWARHLHNRVMQDPLLADRVFFTGFVEDVPSLLLRCEVLVVPSLVEEALGNVVLEAKEAGIPAIVFPSGGLPELIEHGEDGFVCKEKSVYALTTNLRHYLEDPLLARRHGAAARASLARLGVYEFAKRWMEVCRRSA